MNKIKEFFTSKTFHEKMNGKHKEIVNYHFDNIEWNIQTTVYGMLTRLFNELDEKHLKDIADLSVFKLRRLPSFRWEMN